MANTPASTSNNAGIVIVELRADLTKLDADLKQAAGKVDAFARNGVSGGSAETRTQTEAVREQTRAQTDLTNATNKQARADADAALKSRQARRDSRQELALLKDEIGDFSSFNGATISDAIFGFDRDKIRLTNLVQSIGDIQRSAGFAGKSLDEMRKLAAGGNEAAANALRAIEPLDLEKQGITKKWKDLNGLVRGVGATITSSLASSFLIGGGIGLATAAIETLVTSAGNLVNALVNPLERASLAADALAASVQKVGGVTRAANILGLSKEETKTLMEFMAARNRQSAIDLDVSYQNLNSEAALLGISPEELTKRKQADERSQQTLKGQWDSWMGAAFKDPLGNGGANLFMGATGLFGALMGLPFGKSGSEVASGLGMFGQRDALRPGSMANNDALAQRQDVYDALDLLGQGKSLNQQQLDLLMSLSDEQARQVILAQQKLAVEKESTGVLTKQLSDAKAQMAMAMGDAYSQFLSPEQQAIVAAQNKLDEAQKKLTDAQAKQTEAGFQKSLDDAASSVSMARVRTAGMTAYEVQANVIEAKFREQQVKDQVATQKKQTELLGDIAKANKELAAANQSEKIAKLAESIKNLGDQLDFSKVQVLMNGEPVGHLVAPTVYSDIKSFERYGTAGAGGK